MINNTESSEHEQFEAVKAFFSNCGAQFVMYNNNVHLAMLKENSTFILDPNPIDFKTLKRGEENDYYLNGVKCERVKNGDEEPVRDDEEPVRVDEEPVRSDEELVVSDEESLVEEEKEPDLPLPLIDFPSSADEPTSKALLEDATTNDRQQLNMFFDDAASVERREEGGGEEGIMSLRTDSLITTTERSDGYAISRKRKQYQEDHALPVINKKINEKGTGPLTAFDLKLKLETSYKDSVYIEKLQQRMITAYQSSLGVMEDLAMIQGALIDSANVNQVVSQMQLIRERLNTNKIRLRFFEFVLCWMDSKVYDIYRSQGYSADQIYDLMNQDPSSQAVGRAFTDRLIVGNNVDRRNHSFFRPNPFGGF
ncbi:unnamed protein product [Mucor hiemalis]